jgi:hypothetical protein
MLTLKQSRKPERLETALGWPSLRKIMKISTKISSYSTISFSTRFKMLEIKYTVINSDFTFTFIFIFKINIEKLIIMVV